MKRLLGRYINLLAPSLLLLMLLMLLMPLSATAVEIDKKALKQLGKEAAKAMSKMKPEKKAQAVKDPIGVMKDPSLGGGIGLGNMGSGGMEVDIRGDKMDAISSIIGEQNQNLELEIGEITKGYDDPTPGEITGAGDVGRDAEEAIAKLQGLLDKVDGKSGSMESTPSKVVGIVAMTESLADIDDQPSGQGPTGQPKDQAEPVIIPGLKEFQQKNREMDAKAMAGELINYGDVVQGATNTLEEAAAKAKIDDMTIQYEPGYQAPPGGMTEAEKQSVKDKAAALLGEKF